MSDTQNGATPEHAKLATLDQTSAGGVVVRQTEDGLEVVIVAVGNPERWQLPKGIVDAGEVAEATALREVCEEAQKLLAFKGERQAVAQATALLAPTPLEEQLSSKQSQTH